MAIATTISSGASANSSSDAPIRSSARLLRFDAVENFGASIESSGMSPIWSTVRAPSRNSNRRGTMSTATPASRHTRSACSSSSWWARGEGDHHAVDLLERDEVAQRRQAAEVGEVGGAGHALLVVVDVAGQCEPELRVVLDPLGEPPRDEAGADDQRALAQLRRPVRDHAGAGAGDAGHRGAGERAEEGAAGRVVDRHRGEQAEQRPRDGQAGEDEPRRLADPTRPGAEVLAGVEPAQEGGHRPGDRQHDGEHQGLDRARVRHEADQRAGDDTGHGVGDEEQAAEVLEAPSGRVEPLASS